MHNLAKGGAKIPKIKKATQAKRSRELLQQVRRQEKEERRTERKAEKAKAHPLADGDPDLVGIVPGPQPSPTEET